MTLLLDVLTIFSFGLLIGTEFAVSAFVNPVVWTLEDRGQAMAVKSFATTFGRIMPFWYGANLILLIAEIVLRWHKTGAFLLLAAAAIWVAVILLTLLFLVPANNRLAALDPAAFSVAARQEHHRWDAGHRMRVGALCIAYLLLLLVLLRAA